MRGRKEKTKSLRKMKRTSIVKVNWKSLKSGKKRYPNSKNLLKNRNLHTFTNLKFAEFLRKKSTK